MATNDLTDDQLRALFNDPYTPPSIQLECRLAISGTYGNGVLLPKGRQQLAKNACVLYVVACEACVDVVRKAAPP